MMRSVSLFLSGRWAVNVMSLPRRCMWEKRPTPTMSRPFRKLHFARFPAIRHLPGKAVIRNDEKRLALLIGQMGRERHVLAAQVHVGKEADADNVASLSEAAFCPVPSDTAPARKSCNSE